MFVKWRALYILLTKSCEVLWNSDSIARAWHVDSSEDCQLECPCVLCRVTLSLVHQPHCLGRLQSSQSPSASRAAAACMEKYTHESCNADSCPLETDLSPVKHATQDPHNLDLNYGQKGERPRLHPLSHLPFSFVRKIDF